jgi:molybdopterin molybdotransferase
MNSECTWDEARAISENTFEKLKSEKITINLAFNRILAQDVYSLIKVPQYKTSAMDGWVIRGEGPWKINGEVFAGTATKNILHSGEAMRIATGAVVPDGGEGILPWENAKESNGFISGEILDGDHIRPAGTECEIGDLLLSAGEKVKPFHLGLFAACGIDEIEVVVKPQVVIFIIGDELLESGLPKDGKIRDSLGIQLPSFLIQHGAEVKNTHLVKDNLNKLIEIMAIELNSCDLIITTGGTADGPKDFIKAALSELNAKILIDRVKVRPGYHVLINSMTRKSGRSIPIISLPGNPQSAISSLTAFGIPIIYSLAGKKIGKLQLAKMGLEMSTPAGFSRQVPGNLIDEKFMPAKYLGSAMLRGLANSTGFAVLSPGINEQGKTVRWLEC